MKITWVNYASFLLSAGEVNLICDPWLEGTAFDDGWSLLSKTVFPYEEFSRVTHIYFTNEHPDHFSPPCLKKIPEECRRRIQVIFQRTRDRRVAKYCESLGFRVQEPPAGSWVPLSSEVRLFYRRHSYLDSWMAVRSGGKTLLNLNDCVFDADGDVESVRRDAGPVDVLLTQFSYTDWAGNPGDHEAHRRHAQLKLRQVERQARILKPRRLIPFASYVWFSHEENCHLNCCLNKIGDVDEFVRSELKTEPVVLYPGDVWTLGDKHDSTAALERYQQDYQTALSSPPTHQTKSASLENLITSAQSFFTRARKRNNPCVLKMIPPSNVLVTDMGVTFRISFGEGLSVVKASNAKADIAISSEALAYCLAYDWGCETLAINGRYTAPAGGRPGRFFRIFLVSAHNGAGKRVDLNFLSNVVKRGGLRRLRTPERTDLPFFTAPEFPHGELISNPGARR